MCREWRAFVFCALYLVPYEPELAEAASTKIKAPSTEHQSSYDF
jgi:hypothetical protein